MIYLIVGSLPFVNTLVNPKLSNAKSDKNTVYEGWNLAGPILSGI
jgi:hypothetical protein